MPTLSQVIAAPVMQQISEKSLFGKPFVRGLALFGAIRAFMYQQGGALGFGLTGHATLPGKLLGVQPELTASYVESLRKREVAHLPKVEGQEKNFIQLYIARELRAMDIDIAAYPLSKGLGQKAPREFSNIVIALAFDGGADLGYHCPHIFNEYQDNTYRIVPDNRRQEMRAYSLALPNKQEPRSLKEAVADMGTTPVNGQPLTLQTYSPTPKSPFRSD